MFASSQVVLMTHGAALTGTLFMAPVRSAHSCTTEHESNSIDYLLHFFCNFTPSRQSQNPLYVFDGSVLNKEILLRG